MVPLAVRRQTQEARAPFRDSPREQLRDVSFRILNRMDPKREGFPGHELLPCLLQLRPRDPRRLPLRHLARLSRHSCFELSGAPEAFGFRLDHCAFRSPEAQTISEDYTAEVPSTRHGALVSMVSMVSIPPSLKPRVTARSAEMSVFALGIEARDTAPLVTEPARVSMVPALALGILVESPTEVAPLRSTLGRYAGPTVFGVMENRCEHLLSATSSSPMGAFRESSLIMVAAG